jgi:hypothetical protein
MTEVMPCYKTFPETEICVEKTGEIREKAQELILQRVEKDHANSGLLDHRELHLPPLPVSGAGVQLCGLAA